MPIAGAFLLEPVSVVYITREIRSSNLTVSSVFPSPAGDYLESPVDLVAWMIRHEHATFWCKVSGNSLSGLGIMDGDFVAVDRAGTQSSKISGRHTIRPLSSGQYTRPVSH